MNIILFVGIMFATAGVTSFYILQDTKNILIIGDAFMNYAASISFFVIGLILLAIYCVHYIKADSK